MSDFITRFNDGGICEIDIEMLKKQWDFNYSISARPDINDEYGYKYTLARYSCEADNFTHSDMKIEISKEDAHQIVRELHLQFVRNSCMRGAGTYRWHGSEIYNVESGAGDIVL